MAAKSRRGGRSGKLRNYIIHHTQEAHWKSWLVLVVYIRDQLKPKQLGTPVRDFPVGLSEVGDPP